VFSRFFLRREDCSERLWVREYGIPQLATQLGIVDFLSILPGRHTRKTDANSAQPFKDAGSKVNIRGEHSPPGLPRRINGLKDIASELCHLAIGPYRIRQRATLGTSIYAAVAEGGQKFATILNNCSPDTGFSM